jgi:hypothetical protein
LDVLADALCRGSLFIPLPSDRQDFTGDLTYYDSTGLGACGQVLTDNDPIVAVSHFLYDAVAVGTNPNDNPLCGLKIRAERFDEQVNAMRSVDLTVADRCGYLPSGSMRKLLTCPRYWLPAERSRCQPGHVFEDGRSGSRPGGCDLGLAFAAAYLCGVMGCSLFVAMRD